MIELFYETGKLSAREYQAIKEQEELDSLNHQDNMMDLEDMTQEAMINDATENALDDRWGE